LGDRLHGDGYDSRRRLESAPFDAVVTVASREVPAALIARLAPGGRLVTP
jgi:protein-L-isoaspartate O-methyltransferase